MNSCLYEGWVRHRRFTPVEHAFRYRIFMTYLDLSELSQVFRGRALWSTRRPALAWFRRADHLGDEALDLAQAVCDLVQRDTGRRPAGPIRLLTHLRYFGYGFNPVSFYYCFDASDTRVEAIVAEVNNTPWGERHCYVLADARNRGHGRQRRYHLRKVFHVSPFMAMDIDYDWRLSDPGPDLMAHMSNLKDGEKIFDATLVLRRRPMTAGSMARVLLVYPLMTARVSTAIYWQALRLWWKRCPFYAHPNQESPAAAKTR